MTAILDRIESGVVITVDEAYSIIQEQFKALDDGSTSVEQLTDSETREPLFADRDYPPFDRVTMDGICVDWESYQGGLRTFEIEGVSAAGSAQCQLRSPSGCFEIMTGAPLSKGASLVIPYEHISIEPGIARVIVNEPRPHFENVHKAGSDCVRGDEILKAGRSLTGPRWGIATSFGYATVRTRKIPRVKIISTGDEIVDLGKTPLAFQVRRSSAYALRATLLQNGYQTVDLDHVNDDRKAIETHFHANVSSYDMLLYIGGVSKGKFDFLPEVWTSSGVKKYFHQVSQRPGKPLWFGMYEATGTAIIGLPGNPVSSLVCLNRYVLKRPAVFARLCDDISFNKNLTYFPPVKLTYASDGVTWAAPLKMKNSGEFLALAESDGFIELPQGAGPFLKNQSYRFYPWGRTSNN